MQVSSSYRRVLVHSFRPDLFWPNLGTIFDLEYERYIDLRGYNKIEDYYFNEEDYNDYV